MVDPLKAQRWLRAVVGTLALGAIVFYAMRGRRPRGRSGARHPLRTPVAYCVANRAALEAALADRPGLAAGHASPRIRNRSHRNADARQEEHHRAHICCLAHRRPAGLHAGDGHRRWSGRQARRPADQRRDRHARRTRPVGARVDECRKICRSIRSKRSCSPRPLQPRFATTASRSSRSVSNGSRCRRKTFARSSSKCARNAASSPRSSKPRANRKRAAIRSEAELEAARIRAKGEEEQARIRGKSAAEVAKTYADAHKINPELYRFTRSLESLDKLVTTHDDSSTANRLRAVLAPSEQGSVMRKTGPPSEIGRLALAGRASARRRLAAHALVGRSR